MNIAIPFFRAVLAAIAGIFLLVPWSSTRAQMIVTTVPVGVPRALAVNPTTNKIYVATCNRISGLAPQGGFSVIDGQSNTAAAIANVGGCAAVVAVNPATNKIYVANGVGVTLIDGATSSTTTLSSSAGTAVAVNVVTNKIYVGIPSSAGEANITVIDGATNSTTTIAEPNTAGLAPVAMAVNSVTNKIYVANSGSSTNPGNITVIDGVTNATATVNDPNAISPVSVAINSNTNKIYVANMGNYPGTNRGNVTVINGATNSITTISDPNAISPGGPDTLGFGVGVNSVTNKIYVSNEQSNNVTVIDGATNTTITLTDPNAVAPVALAVNSSSNMVYVANKGYPGSVTAINAATNSLTTLIGGAADAAAVNPTTNRIYAGDGGGVAVIDGGAVATSHIVMLSLAGSGFGTVASNPAGLNCNGPPCSASFAVGTSVTITAEPASYSTFSGWGSACTGVNQCNLTMDSDYFVAATFSMKPSVDFSLQPASPSLTVQGGSPVTDAITLSGTPGAIVQLSCLVTQSGPIPLNCALSSSSVVLTGSAVTTTLTVTVGSPSAELLPARKAHLAAAFYAGFLSIPGLPLMGLCLFKATARTRTRVLLWSLCGVLVVIAGQTGCGGGGSPPHTYTVVVTGNVVGFSGAIEQQTFITVTAP